jgi:hypothetical protein
MMLQWTDQPNGGRRAFFTLGNRFGWVELTEATGGDEATVRAVATIMLGAMGPQDKAKLEASIEEWLGAIGAEPLSQDGL